ncbi:hypothetical protein [Chitinophaga japonensis]|uniref:Uncharacterized protein n=1 Tax=Chitinophaga japonensis TaxID=104662 RepID=A0A562T4F7_CHIJA|nr:hypothetical protein [Chitinophaga japonensis]TWI88392.1 hypothetical protein LX66_2477 [Chitinophaga japonensis]
MKRLFPIALLLCLSFSLSSFAPASKHSVTIKKGAYPSFPITGQTTAGGSLLDYSITSSSGPAPYYITFYAPNTGEQVGGPYPFELNSVINGEYYYGCGGMGTGMYAELNITAVELRFRADATTYTVNFIPGV